MAGYWWFFLSFFGLIAYWLIRDRQHRLHSRQGYDRSPTGSGEPSRSLPKSPRPTSIDFFLDDTPSPPANFGYKTSWLAVRSDDAERVAFYLNGEGKPTYRTNLEKGISAALEYGFSYVLPPIDGWVLVLSPHLLEPALPTTMAELGRMAGHFPEVLYFGNYSVARAGWLARYRDGRLLRRLTVVGGDILHSTGELSPEEQAIVTDALAGEADPEYIEYLSEKNYARIFGDADYILRLAGAWSINPQLMQASPVQELGILINE